MKKILFVLIILSLIFNLGNILDLTDKLIVKSDIIVVLGGGEDKRIKKGLELFKNDYSISHKLVFTGNNKYYIKNTKNYFQENGILEKDIFVIDNVQNTMEEIKALKIFFKNNNFKSILFVTHPTHTLRIKLLANYFSNYEKENIIISFASADHTNVWNKNLYFLELESIKLVILEFSKIIFNFTKYSISN